MNNSLAEVHPELVSEWSEKNLTLTPDDITFGSNKKVWWRGACGHEWQASVKARSNGEKCPICSGARDDPQPQQQALAVADWLPVTTDPLHATAAANEPQLKLADLLVGQRPADLITAIAPVALIHDQIDEITGQHFGSAAPGVALDHLTHPEEASVAVDPGFESQAVCHR